VKSEECESIFEALSQYLDGELGEADCQALESHIQGCGPCVEFVESLRKSIRLGRQFRSQEPVPPLSAESKQALLEAYRKSLQKP
jgi:anti-sigma factor RsiW